MKYWMTLLLGAMLWSLNVRAEVTVVTLGHSSTEVLYFQKRSTAKQNVYIFGYRSPIGQIFQRVVPASSYQKSLVRLRQWEKQFARGRRDCGDRVVVTRGKKLSVLCFDPVSASEKGEFTSWVSRYLDVIMGNWDRI